MVQSGLPAFFDQKVYKQSVHCTHSYVKRWKFCTPLYPMVYITASTLHNRPLLSLIVLLKYLYLILLIHLAFFWKPISIFFLITQLRTFTYQKFKVNKLSDRVNLALSESYLTFNICRVVFENFDENKVRSCVIRRKKFDFVFQNKNARFF